MQSRFPSPVRRAGFSEAVGVVAGKTRPFPEGLVLDPSRFQPLLVMALVTESAPLFRRSERLRRCGRIVAVAAACFGDGFMGTRFQQFRLRRRMGVVAEGARGRFHRIAAVRLLERPFPGIVTGNTQRDRRLDQQVFFVGSVGEVARLASARGQDFVDGFLLVAFLLVALVAKLGTFRLQEVTRLGGVRVMARGAFPARQCGVNIGLVHPDFLLAVAGVADLVALFLEDQPRNDPVADMALLAFFLLGHGVHIFHRRNIYPRIFYGSRDTPSS